MSGPSLYELGTALTEAFAEIDAELVSNDGEFTEAMQQRLDAAEMAFSEKVERVALYIRSLSADALAIKTEEARLKARREAAEKRATWLKDVYLRHALASQGKTEVAGRLATVRLQQNPPAATATVDLCFLDPRWVRKKDPELSLDKEAILAAYKAGEKLPPELKVERGTSIQIK